VYDENARLSAAGHRGAADVAVRRALLGSGDFARLRAPEDDQQLPAFTHWETRLTRSASGVYVPLPPFTLL